ncbi:potassium channel subfamily K member 15 [Ixodes scapularis]|uniref:potassium channel subfamily K member 15 n=1 Tax=Ixodes scapularis TaxID=6945 RepID=UPI001A9F0E19|nr:potassium channel subfamily K member 15 [Ixodes scapularis]
MPETLTRFARCRRCARIFLTHLVSQVGLCLLVVAYAIVGALIFQAIESGKEVKQRLEVSQLRRQCLFAMWNVTEKLNVLHDVEWMAKVGTKLKEFEDKVVLAVRNDGYDGKEVYEESMQWSFSGALLYSITVITTIGYGNIAPKTPEGKVVTILYAIVGIPLMLLCLSNIGNILAHSFKFFYSHVCCLICHKADAANAKINTQNAATTQIPSEVLDAVVSVANSVHKGHSVDDGTPTKELRKDPLSPPGSPEKTAPAAPAALSAASKANNGTATKHVTTSSVPQDRIPVYLVLLLVTGYICFGATLFSFWEKWSFLDGAYFSFITLSTIGFGDFVPGSALFEQGATSTTGQAKLIICCFYLVLGLAIIAMSFNLVQEEVLLKCKDLVRSLKNLVSSDEATSSASS